MFHSWRLELLTVSSVSNDESWAQFMARREAIRREIDADGSHFERYEVDTMAGRPGDDGESTESMARAMAEAWQGAFGRGSKWLACGTQVAQDDFATPLMQLGLKGLSLSRMTSKARGQRGLSPARHVGRSGREDQDTRLSAARSTVKHATKSI